MAALDDTPSDRGARNDLREPLAAPSEGVGAALSSEGVGAALSSEGVGAEPVRSEADRGVEDAKSPPVDRTPPPSSSLEETVDPPELPTSRSEDGAPIVPPPSSATPGETVLRRVDPGTPPTIDRTPHASPREVRGRAWASRRAVAAIVAIVALGGGALAVVTSGADASHVEAGVTSGDVALGGLDRDTARRRIVELETRLAHKSIPLVLHGKEVRFEPTQAGFAVDVDATLGHLLEAGRAHGFVAKAKALFRGRVDVPLDVSLDDAVLGDLVDDWERRLIDDHPSLGGIRFEGTEPVAEAPKAGHRIDRPQLAKALRAELARGGAGPVEVPVVEERPTLAQADVDAALAKARVLTRGPVTLSREPSADEIAEAEAAEQQRQKRVEEDKALAPKKRTHKKKGKKGKRSEDAPLGPPKAPPPVEKPTALELVFTQADLVAMIRVTPHDAPPGLDVTLDEAEIGRRIDAIAGKLADSARDARFEIDDKDQVTIVPSRAGTRVDPKKVAEAIATAAATEERRGELPVDHGVEPSLTTEAAQKLGIKGLVASFTTHHPCCQPRVINIHRIADIMDGALIKPGDTFSVNKYVGPRNTDRGFVLAPSIGDGEMVDTVGGGISQFATTLFNALFDAGYAIRERKAHSFYFNRYPMGIEATLSDPSPDLIFVNDTSAGLLVKAHYDKTSITVKLYGDTGGRKVERHVSGIFDITDPKTEYEADDKLEPDEEKVKEKGSNGWSVWAGRTITFPDGEKREEKRKITYRARPRLVRTHSCNIPKGEPGWTGKPCPKKEKEEDRATDPTGATGGDEPNDPSHSP
jgi:vancomycin resistance protein YoaR